MIYYAVSGSRAYGWASSILLKVQSSWWKCMALRERQPITLKRSTKKAKLPMKIKFTRLCTWEQKRVIHTLPHDDGGNEQNKIDNNTHTDTHKKNDILLNLVCARVHPFMVLLGTNVARSALIETHFLALSTHPLKQMDSTSIIYYLYVEFAFCVRLLSLLLLSTYLSAFECVIKPNILSEKMTVFLLLLFIYFITDFWLDCANGVFCWFWPAIDTFWVEKRVHNALGVVRPGGRCIFGLESGKKYVY